MSENPRAYDRFGSIVVMKFPHDFSSNKKKAFAKKLMQAQPSITTVLEKVGKFKGRLRTMKTVWVLGEKTKEVLYKENGCEFRFNLDTTYFSPRLASERLSIAKMITAKDSVFVAFAGVAPFPIVIAKHAKSKNVISNELNRKANRYAEQNVRLNKLTDIVQLMSGDFSRVAQKLRSQKKTFDWVIMPRPNLTKTFLTDALKISKKGTKIVYYGFGERAKITEMQQALLDEAKKAKHPIKLLSKAEAGEIGVQKVRMRFVFKVT